MKICKLPTARSDLTRLHTFTYTLFSGVSWAPNHINFIQAKTKKLCGSGNPILPTILVPTLIFFRPVKKILKNRRKSRYCSVQLAIRFGTAGINLRCAFAPFAHKTTLERRKNPCRRRLGASSFGAALWYFMSVPRFFGTPLYRSAGLL